MPFGAAGNAPSGDVLLKITSAHGGTSTRLRDSNARFRRVHRSGERALGARPGIVAPGSTPLAIRAAKEDDCKSSIPGTLPLRDDRLRRFWPLK
jgi:hypothetical protein